VRSENESYQRETKSLREALNHSKESEQFAQEALAHSDTIQSSQNQWIDGLEEENKKLRRQNKFIKIGGVALVILSILIAI
jgi:hypothetical protein